MQLTSRLPSFMHRVKVRAIFYMILSAACFSFVELVAARLVIGITLYQVVWARYVFHILLMIVVLGPRYKTKIVKTNHLSLQIVRSLTMVAMPVCAILAGQYQMPHHDIWAIYWTSPLVMLALSTFILRESAGTFRWIAALVGFVGMQLFFQPDAGIFSRAALLAFGVGVSISLHLMFSRMLRDDHPLSSLFHTALWVLVVMSFFVPVVMQMPTLTNMVGIIIIAIVGLITLYALARAGELAPIPVVAVFSYTEAIFRVIFSVIFLGLLPNNLTILGTLIIIVLTGYMLFHELRQPDIEPEVQTPVGFKEALRSEM